MADFTGHILAEMFAVNQKDKLFLLCLQAEKQVVLFYWVEVTGEGEVTIYSRFKKLQKDPGDCETFMEGGEQTWAIRILDGVDSLQMVAIMGGK